MITTINMSIIINTMIINIIVIIIIMKGNRC